MSVAVALGGWFYNKPPNAGCYVLFACIVTFLYATGASAVVFCNEHESKTYLFLRSLPVSRRTVFAGKILWILSSVVAFLIVAIIIASLFEVCFGDFRGFDFSEVNSIPKEAVIAFLCYLFLPSAFGIFWSTLTRSQLNSVMFTFASLFGCIWPGVIVAAYVRNSYGFEIENYIKASMYFSGIVVLFGGIAIYNGLHWFDIWKDKRIIYNIFQKEDFASANNVAVAMAKHSPWKGEFLSLVRHAFKQSQVLFIYTLCVGLACVLLLTYVATVGEKNTVISGDAVAVFMLVVIVSAVAFCGSVFSGDQKATGAFLCERGISPGKVWWSRIVAFGSVYFGIILLVTVFVINLAAVKHGTAAFHNPDFAFFCVICLGMFTALFCIGQFVSLLIRSGIVSIVMTGIMTWCFLSWGTFMSFYLGCLVMIGISEKTIENAIFVLLWSCVPIIIATVIASRLRITDWFRQRPIRKSRRPVGSVIFVTIFVICTLIPFWRIYTVPVIDYGYHVDKAILEKKITLDYPRFEEMNPNYWHVGVHDAQRGYSAPIDRLLKLRDNINESFTDPDRAIVATNYLYLDDFIVRRLRSGVPRKEGPANDYNPNETKKTNIIPLNELKLEFLDAGIEFLEKLDKNRVPLSTKLKRVYETDYRLAKYGILFDWFRERHKDDPVYTVLKILKYVPWEKTRLLRKLDYQFQFRSRMADQVENAFNSRSGNCGDHLNELQRQYVKNAIEFIYGDSFILHHFGLTDGYESSAHPARMYVCEDSRRMTLIYLAILKYCKEKGELPPKLDDLKTAGYLSEIPKVPGYNFDYYYDPNPDGTESLSRRFNYHEPGVPYILGRDMQDPLNRSFGECIDINVEYDVLLTPNILNSCQEDQRPSTGVGLLDGADAPIANPGSGE